MFVLHFLYPHLKPTRFPKIKDYITKVVPCGLATGLDIGLSNNSLKYITLSFYTMVKSSAPIFVLLFAFMFKLEKPTIKLVRTLLLIITKVWYYCNHICWSVNDGNRRNKVQLGWIHASSERDNCIWIPLGIDTDTPGERVDGNE